MKSLLKSDAAPIDCEKDEKIEIVGHIAAEESCSLELCVCQISKRNIARIHAPQNSAKKQRLQTDGSSEKHLAVDYDSILWFDEKWLKLKQVGQVFLQVFDRKFLVKRILPHCSKSREEGSTRTYSRNQEDNERALLT